MNHNSNADWSWNWENNDKHKHITRIVSVFYSLSLLCSQAARDVQQHQWQIQHQWVHWWHQSSHVWIVHEAELSHTDESSWEMSRLNQIIWDILQFNKIWAHSFISHLMQVQHADYTSDRESDYNVINIDTSTQCMSKSEATLKQAHKENAAQNENSN